MNNVHNILCKNVLRLCSQACATHVLQYIIYIIHIICLLLQYIVYTIHIICLLKILYIYIFKCICIYVCKGIIKTCVIIWNVFSDGMCSHIECVLI